jgi:glycosyltransferase involved in cell wall biosynthesis
MFGNQFIEAALLGTSGIVAEGTAMAENARKIGAGLVVGRQDAAGLARAIAEVLERLPSVAQMLEVRRILVEWMGPEVVARKHLEVYKKVG